MGAKPEKCFLYPGGVDNEVFLRYAAEDNSAFLQKYNIAPGKHIISYLGTLEERKNPLAVLKIAQKLKDQPNIHFMLAGKGDSTYGEEVIKTAANMSNVTYLGEIDEKEKALFIRSSKVNILLSKLESLGITQLEFMYGGVPVVTSGVGGQSWVVQDGIEGLHVKGVGDIDGAVKAILRLTEDETLYKRLSFNARERAGKYASIYLTGLLESAIDRELIKESGLAGMPTGLRDTLTQSEYVLKSWSAGTSGIVATNRRIFFRRGWISRNILEMSYQDIKLIEHSMRYPWKIPLAGAVISGLIYLVPTTKSWLSEDIVNHIKLFLDNLMGLLPNSIAHSGWITPSLIMLPLVISLIIFFAHKRSGFQLHGEWAQPVYLSGKFKKAIEFIRHIQDQELGLAHKPVSTRDTEPLINNN